MISEQHKLTKGEKIIILWNAYENMFCVLIENLKL
jgi:hypothetical protein